MELTQDTVREVFYHDPVDGKLYWKERGKWWFKTKQDWLRWNNLYANEEVNPRMGQFKFQGRTYQKNRVIWLYHTGYLLDGNSFKVMCVNRDRNDRRIENLVCVPMSICIRQKMETFSIANDSFHHYGVIYRPGRSKPFSAYLGLKPGKRIYQDFEDMMDAWEWRFDRELENYYWDLSEFETGEDQDNGWLSRTFERDHEWETKVLSEAHKKKIAAASASKFGETASRFTGWLVGTDVETGKQILVEGLGHAEQLELRMKSLSAVLKGKLREADGFTWERVKEKPDGNFLEHGEAVRLIRKNQSAHANSRKLPWETSNSDKSLWKRADELYDYYLFFDEAGAKKLGNRLGLPQSKLVAAVRFFREFGDPRNHNDWVEFART